MYLFIFYPSLLFPLDASSPPPIASKFVIINCAIANSCVKSIIIYPIGKESVQFGAGAEVGTAAGVAEDIISLIYDFKGKRFIPPPPRSEIEL
jgi:hypothetical protein